MAITYTSLTDAQKMEAADVAQKIEAIDGALAVVQTERAASEVGYVAREEVLRAEKNTLKETLRNIRSVTVA